MACVPAELTRIGERGLSAALSAYSAVTLRKIFPVQTNRMDGIGFNSSPHPRSATDDLGLQAFVCEHHISGKIRQDGHATLPPGHVGAAAVWDGTPPPRPSGKTIIAQKTLACHTCKCAAA